MNKLLKIILTFAVWFAIAYLIAGYIINALFAQMQLTEKATVWDNFREYYMRTFSSNIISFIIAAAAAASVVIYYNRKNP